MCINMGLSSIGSAEDIRRAQYQTNMRLDAHIAEQRQANALMLELLNALVRAGVIQPPTV